MSTVRDELRDRLGVIEETTVGDPVLEELQQRLQGIAPEVRAGDPDALAEQARIEEEIAAEKKRRELDQLAEAELAERQRLAAAAEEERQHEAWRAEKAEVDARCNDALVKFERTLKTVLEAAADALEANADSWLLGQKLGLGRGVNLGMLIENRLLRRVQQELGPKYGIRPGMVLGSQGIAPLAVAASERCAVCTHEQADEITAAINDREESGESLRAISERFGVGRTTLRSHAAHVPGN